MQVKKYQAINIKEALKMVKNDLGPDAIILSSKTIPPEENSFGLMDKTMIEVTAVVDQNNERSTTTKASKFNTYQNRSDGILTNSRVSLSENSSYNDNSDSVQTAVLTIKDDVNNIIENNASHFSSQINLLKTEINDIKWLLKSVFQDDSLTEEAIANNPFVQAFKKLILNGVDRQLAAEIIELAKDNLSEELKDDQEMVFEQVRKELRKLIFINYNEDSNRTKVIALVGPTGVGKTTTLAKITAKKTIEEKKKVGIITLDTFRIGAVEQLRTYAQIINVPLKVARNNVELTQILKTFSDKDIIMIDTVGHSQKNINQIKKLQKTFEFNPIIENHLVLSSTTKEKDQFSIIDAFEMLNIDSLIFTKLDETNELGSIFNIGIKTNKPISYITNGQNVPEDIMKATKENVVAAIFN